MGGRFLRCEERGRRHFREVIDSVRMIAASKAPPRTLVPESREKLNVACRSVKPLSLARQTAYQGNEYEVRRRDRECPNVYSIQQQETLTYCVL